MQRIIFWLERLTAAMTLAALAACGSVQSVPVRDQNSPAFAVRGTFHGKSGEASRPAGPGIEVGYERYSAKDTQVLGVGQSVVLEGASFTGPDTLQHKARMQYGYVAYNHRLRFGESFELEPFVGAARVHFKLHTHRSSGTGATGVDDRRTGVLGGVTPRWRFNDWLALEARFSYLYTSAWATGESYEAALVLSPVPQVSLRLGYSERKHDIESAVPGATSEVNVRARGPMATLQFDF
jgi:hypothetical protein